MTPHTIFFIEFLSVFGLSAIVARLYLWKRLSALPLAQALPPLLLVHAGRVVGLTSLLPGVVDPRLSFGFIHPQAYGDLLAATLACIAMALLFAKSRLAVPFTWLFSIVGLADFTLATINAQRYDIYAHLGSYWFIPMVVVPPLLMAHILILMLLVQKARRRAN